MKRATFLFSFLFSTSIILAQCCQHDKPMQSHFDVGIGAGLDYGGYGFKFEAYPVSYVSLFGGVGYNLIQPGFSVGITARNPKFDAVPFVTAMYGYNASIIVKGEKHLNENFVGPSFGLGMEFHFWQISSFLNFALLYPIRNSDYDDTRTMLENMEYLDPGKEPFPMTLSIGFHYMLQ